MNAAPDAHVPASPEPMNVVLLIPTSTASPLVPLLLAAFLFGALLHLILLPSPRPVHLASALGALLVATLLSSSPLAGALASLAVLLQGSEVAELGRDGPAEAVVGDGEGLDGPKAPEARRDAAGEEVAAEVEVQEAGEGGVREWAGEVVVVDVEHLEVGHGGDVEAGEGAIELVVVEVEVALNYGWTTLPASSPS